MRFLGYFLMFFLKSLMICPNFPYSLTPYKNVKFVDFWAKLPKFVNQRIPKPLYVLRGIITFYYNSELIRLLVAAYPLTCLLAYKPIFMHNVLKISS